MVAKINDGLTNAQRYTNKNKHKCAIEDCQRLVGKDAIRCKACIWMSARDDTRTRFVHSGWCLDCGNKLSDKRNVRCFSCFTLHSTTGRNFPSCVDCGAVKRGYNGLRCQPCGALFRWQNKERPDTRKCGHDWSPGYGKNRGGCRVCARAAIDERHLKARRAIDDAKNKPCMDCQQNYPSYVMDFDHRPEETKLFNIGSGASKSKPLKLIVAEIAKCDVVCGNCHRERTRRRLEVLNNQ